MVGLTPSETSSIIISCVSITISLIMLWVNRDAFHMINKWLMSREEVKA